MTDSTAASTSIQVLSRMFSLLDTLAHEGDAISLKSISEQTGLHPSTAHRILNDLAVGRLVERSGPGSYRLGLRLLELGNLVKSRLDVRELAVKPMQELHKLTGHSVSLFVRVDDDALCIERTVAERNSVQVTRVMGLRIPLTSCAAGKTLLSNESGSGLSALAHAQSMKAETLQSEVNAIRQSGLAQDHDGHEAASQMIAAPIFNDLGEVVASMTLNMPTARATPEWIDALKATAHKVSNALGWKGQ
ncbi:MAG: IclR family transcriptional regulator [Burkholderiales bacterium]|nr:IclR family transcriptional regulator [Burkholderiales bacterium]MDE2077502.1 IclR family transcriptional regulator [Burkholderiales bacterium]MDE2431768.1 IclR family transcriptional regulator [Burkholderiales bacterium]